MDEHKVYLGDSVYVDVENGDLVLYTDNGIESENHIYMELETLKNFLDYLYSKGIFQKTGDKQ